MKAVATFAAFCFLITLACAQDKPVPVGDESHHQQVLDNQYTRVFHVVVLPKQSTLVHQHDHDYVWVQIGAGDISNDLQGRPPAQVKLSDGQVRFTKGGFAHKVTNLADTPFVNITIEVKKPSTKAMCGATWAGQGAGTVCAPTSGAIGGAVTFVKAQNLQTDAVEADSVIAPSAYSIDATGGPILIVALNQFTVKPTAAAEKKLGAGDVFWLGADQLASVVPGSGQPARLVTVEFK